MLLIYCKSMVYSVIINRKEYEKENQINNLGKLNLIVLFVQE